MKRYLEWKRRALVMAANHWWQPSGVRDDQIYSAYRFKGADSREAALHDLTEHGWNLQAWNADKAQNNIFWSKEKGFHGENPRGEPNPALGLYSINAKDSQGNWTESLNFQDIRAAVIKYKTGFSPINPTEDSALGLTMLGGQTGLAYLNLSAGYVNGYYDHDYETEWANVPEGGWGGGDHYTNRGSIAIARNYKAVFKTKSVFNQGIIGVSWNNINPQNAEKMLENKVYINGVVQVIPTQSSTDWRNLQVWELDDGGTFPVNPSGWDYPVINLDNMPISYDADVEDGCDIWYGTTRKLLLFVHAAAFYGTPLNDSQMMEVYNGMKNL